MINENKEINKIVLTHEEARQLLKRLIECDNTFRIHTEKGYYNFEVKNESC